MVLKKNCAVYVTLKGGKSINYKLNCSYAPHCPSFDVYLIYTTFRKLAIPDPALKRFIFIMVTLFYWLYVATLWMALASTYKVTRVTSSKKRHTRPSWKCLGQMAPCIPINYTFDTRVPVFTTMW